MFKNDDMLFTAWFRGKWLKRQENKQSAEPSQKPESESGMKQ